MFETRSRLHEDVSVLLGVLRDISEGAYVSLLDRTGVLAESASPDASVVPKLRGVIAERTESIFALPGAMAADGPTEDVFEGFAGLGFLVAILNGRVALVVACADPASARGAIEAPFKALADRLFRINPAWRTDEKGRGIFFSRPRLDWIVVEKGES